MTQRYRCELFVIAFDFTQMRMGSSQDSLREHNQTFIFSGIHVIKFAVDRCFKEYYFGFLLTDMGYSVYLVCYSVEMQHDIGCMVVEKPTYLISIQLGGRE